MAKVKITTLTDKISDDEILTRLKGLGVKIKDKAKEEPTLAKKDDEKLTSSGETMVEKRVASTIIRRRVKPPQPQKEKAEVVEEEVKPEEKKPEKKETVVRRASRKAEKVEEKKEIVQPQDQPEIIKIEKIEKKEEHVAPVLTERDEDEEQNEEALKGDIEIIGEEKKKEITKVLEEAYKQDLEKDFTLVESEPDEGIEEKKKRKTERLLKKIEEQDAEETKLKKKGILKRKVVIKEEDLYTFRRQKARPIPGRKDRKEKPEEKKIEEKVAELKPTKKIVKVGEEIQIGELAKRMNVKAQDIIKKLLPLGIIATVNQDIDFDTAYLVGTELGFEIEKIISIEEEFFAREEEGKENEKNLHPRPPVVTIMGHVDHGKTLLLDTIRHSNIAEREAGGITQHIGAYVVDVNGKEIVFVDTPGHEAFTAMRARGARVTDIVVLVVAADDGVMPQTIEAINHAKAANVPIIVAVNKIDRQNANIDKVLKELAEQGLVPEEWGGTTLLAKISAKKKIGITELLELIILQAEMLELKANPDMRASGIIIESELDKGQGPVGTVIIQEGTLKIQDPFIAGTMFGRVRAMIDDKGKRIQKAPPSTPVLVVGFQDVPHGGDRFIATTEERYAKELSRYRQEKLRERETAKSSRTTLEELYSKMGKSEKIQLGVIIKADVRGTIDAITEALKKLSNDLVEIQIIHGGAGAITETDVNLAMASGAIIIGFNVKPIGKAQALAEQEKIEIRTYSIIYDMIDDVKKAMEGLLEPKLVETDIGKAEVRKVFAVSKIGTVAGSYILEGKVTRNAMARVMRNSNHLFTGKISSLKRFKDDVKEVQAGYECGISLEGFNDLQEGDSLEFFVQEKERQTLDG
ncbi:MAG: translation initiation factor IF-2 [Syntrophorhabdus sp.]|jgi:translation initiation factor IF-2|nr:translation initiation factor IF-2 [Syntrophorhabdus sp.]MDI9558509.1 translation initiation factor IF-2 [Pseudomonadota bacterium]OPX94568.1 MAG: Translation initiation factor IF-2 [Syntrophorhabdus sp. PtaB.Bin027]OQB78325.1 MAG: Translation initiation factor IF-2 [Deltaproteobacteria bacterium ADurb.Bin135]MBP8744544.1 translation initiation factor IF-2 [Syntrophorhabdus sp.]